MKRSDALVTVVALLCGCAAEAPGRPQPTSIEPATGFTTRSTDVTIRGSAFRLDVEARLDGGARVDAGFRARLGATELEDVVRVDGSTLRARVPAGMAPGAYDLTVEGPHGGGTLPAAFEVVVRPADLSAIAAASRTRVSVGQELQVTLAVTNGGDAGADVAPALELAGTAAADVVGEPLPGTVAGGRTETFTWRLVARSAGSLTVRARVDGTDASTSQPVAAFADAPRVQVDTPPELVATATASAAEVNEGQPFTVTLEIENRGGADALVTPALVASGTAVAVTPPGPGTLLVGAGTSATATWPLAAPASGTAALFLSAPGVDLNSGAEVPAASASVDVRVDRPALLVTTASAPAKVSAGQLLVVTVKVENTGDAAADVAASLDVSGTAGLETQPPQADAVPGGDFRTFQWTFPTAASGIASFAARVAGTDANDGAPLAGAAGATTTVQRGAALAGRAAAAPTAVGPGGAIDVTLEVWNDGEATAIGVRPDPPILTGAGATLVSGPTPASADLAGGAVPATFRWTYQAPASGELAFTIQAHGLDENSRASVLTDPSRTALVTVQAPGELTAALGTPERATPPTTFTATVLVTNTGVATITNVAPSLSFARLDAGTATAAIGARTPATSVELRQGASQTFTWPVTVTGEGLLDFVANVAGIDSVAGEPRAASDHATTSVYEVEELSPSADPFGNDGTTFAYVVGYRGQLWLGPNRTGTRLARLRPDGAFEPVAFRIHRDESKPGQEFARNDAYSLDHTYASLGFTGCRPDSFADACGPDDEDGRGLLTSAVVGGVEWLVAGSGRSGGELAYVYLTSDGASNPTFAYVDLSAVLGSATRGFSAAQGMGSKLYLGFPDNGGSRPYGVALNVMPTGNGLDFSGSSTTGATNLRLDEAFKLTGASFTTTTVVDTLVEFKQRLYAFSNVGCVAQKTSTLPLSSADFASCSPPKSTAYDPVASIDPARQADLEPREKAWPQAAVWNDVLYVIRNTTAIAQVWACDLGRSGDPSIQRCESGDWAPVANFSSADGDGTTPRASLLVATPDHLYLGLEYADGVRLYRAAAPPTRNTSFTGQGGCAAGAACPGLRGNGLGFGATRFLDAKALALGGAATPSLYFTARAGTTGSVHVFRVER